MSQYNPYIYHRRSIRLKGYDYASAGLYFVTICTQKRECLFGEIQNGEMVLNDAGRMVERWYNKTQENFPDIVCHEMIVMPNHFHCIWENVGLDNASGVGANPCVRPVINIHGINEGAHAGAPLRDVVNDSDLVEIVSGSPLSAVVGWFKTMSTNEYIRGVKQLDWPPFDRKLWQRNYYEHIIRNEQSFYEISNYIINNPARWAEDKFYPDD
jgi:REP element-mobilizing transposase RayT